MSVTGRRPLPRIAVLGADGFIGSHAMQMAQQAGASPVGFCVKAPWRLSGESHGLVPIPRGEWWTNDFLCELKDSLQNIDALLLLAYTPPPDQRRAAWESHEWKVNVRGAERILDLTSKHGVRLVFASSADVYGSMQPGRVAEETEPRPATPYARAKHAVEEMLQQAAPSGDACALRIATVFGPGENGPRAIPSFIRAFLSGTEPEIHGSGTDVRDYVHVRDVSRALLQAARIEREPIQDCGGVFNVGSGLGRTTLDVLAAVASVMGKQPRAEHVPSSRMPSHLVLDPSRAARMLGFRADHDFESGILEEVAWLRHRLSESHLHATKLESDTG